jgi:trimeric autotransporter adhesin
MKKYVLFLLALILLTTQGFLRAQGTAFTYQGRLQNSGSPANGNYDFTFALYDGSDTNAGEIGGPLTDLDVGVTDGLFTVTLDFGPVFDGGATWLAIGVRPNGGSSFTTLNPLQELTPTPYAMYAPNAGYALTASTANSAETATTAITAGSANSVAAVNITGALGLGQLPGSVVTNFETGVTLGGAFGGDGSGLNLLNASQLAAGTVPNGVLSGFQGPNYQTVGGGLGNAAGGGYATVGGGYENSAGGPFNTVAGGYYNNASGPNATIGGGVQNVATYQGTTVAGGSENDAGGPGAFVGGGGFDGSTFNGNSALGAASTVAGGLGNTADQIYDTVVGGVTNIASGGSAFVGGGQYNTAGDQFATIAGGSGNSSGYEGFVGGGQYNDASEQGATVVGGYDNTASGQYAALGGGYANNSTGRFATVAGGTFLTASGPGASVGGGGYNGNNYSGNTASGGASTVPGGYGNTAGGLYSFAAGQQAQALNQGAFVWADSQNATFSSTANDQFCVRAQGGMQIDPSTSLFFGAQTRQMLSLYSNSVTTYAIGVQNDDMYFRCGADVAGTGFAWYRGGQPNSSPFNAGGGSNLMTLTTSGLTVNGTFVSSSDRNVKQGFAPVDCGTVLQKVSQLPVQTWAYKDDPGTKHLGPMAQDFYAAFGTGADDKHIAVVDEGGVALAAIQGLNQKLEAANAELKQQNETLAARMAELEAEVRALAEKK